MPWTKENPPKCAKNWTDEEKQKCVKAANAVLSEGGSETDAIRACIHNAGKTVHPGGKGSLSPVELAQLMEQLGEMGLGVVTMEVQATEFEVLFDDNRMVVLGAVSPDIDFSRVRALYFRNAILARQESNKNKDRLPPEEVSNLAKTIGGMPIDDEHQFQVCIGCYTKGAEIEDSGRLAVATDGIIWAQRFPDIARQIVAGEKHLSMEVWIGSATCSMCNETYTSRDDYCAHLKHKEAERILHDVVGFGGAATRKPAGSNTLFDADRMLVVASAHTEGGFAVGDNGAGEFEMTVDVMDDEDYVDIMAVIGGYLDEASLGKKLEYQERQELKESDFALIQTTVNKRTGKKVKVRRFPIHDCSHAANALARLPNAKDLSSSERASIKSKAESKLASDACKNWRSKMKGQGTMTEEELQARVTELEGELAQARDKSQTLESELATAKTDLQTAQKAQADLQWSIREQALKQAGYDEEKLKTEKQALAALSDQAFDILFAALHKKPADKEKEKDKDTAKGSVVLGVETPNPDDKPRLVL